MHNSISILFIPCFESISLHFLTLYQIIYIEMYVFGYRAICFVNPTCICVVTTSFRKMYCSASSYRCCNSYMRDMNRGEKRNAPPLSPHTHDVSFCTTILSSPSTRDYAPHTDDIRVRDDIKDVINMQNLLDLRQQKDQLLIVYDNDESTTRELHKTRCKLFNHCMYSLAKCQSDIKPTDGRTTAIKLAIIVLHGGDDCRMTDLATETDVECNEESERVVLSAVSDVIIDVTPETFLVCCNALICMIDRQCIAPCLI